MILRVLMAVDFVAVFETTVVEVLTQDSFEDPRMVIILPTIVAVQAFLVLTAIPNIWAILGIIEYPIQFSVRVTSAVIGDQMLNHCR